MRIALAQINNTVGDLEANAAKILDFARRGEQAGADVVAFPELALTGYPPRDLVEKQSFLDRTAATLQAVADEAAGLHAALIVGYVASSPPNAAIRAQNAAALISNGRISWSQAKMLLPNYDVFDEARYFGPPSANIFARLARHARSPSPSAKTPGTTSSSGSSRLYQRDPVEELAQKPARRSLICINASPYNIGKRAMRRETILSRDRAPLTAYPVVYVNQVGGNDQLVFDGTSFAMNAAGDVAARAKSFEEDLVLFDGSSRHRRRSCQIHLMSDEAAYRGAGAGYPRLHPQVRVPQRADRLERRHRFRAHCGCHRRRSRGQGERDRRWHAGPVLLRTQPHGRPRAGPESRHPLRNCVDQRQPIDAMIQDADAVIRRFQHATSTEENLQSRLRGVTLMALSNKTGALVLTTGNKSEIAVGYCTLYGDMCGGLAVISDVPKTMVYRLARVANSHFTVRPAAADSRKCVYQTAFRRASSGSKGYRLPS